MTDMRYMDNLDDVAMDAIELIREKTGTYGDSWKRRGGPGAWFTTVRPIDRLEGIMRKFDGDIFAAIEKDPTGRDGSALACVRDIMNYCILIEAHARAVLGVGRHGPVRKAKEDCDTFECDNCHSVNSSMLIWADEERCPGKRFCGERCARIYRAESGPSPASGSHHAFIDHGDAELIHPDDAEGGGSVQCSVCSQLDGHAPGCLRAAAMESAGEDLDERPRATGSRVPALAALPRPDRLAKFETAVREAARDYDLRITCSGGNDGLVKTVRILD